MINSSKYKYIFNDYKELVYSYFEKIAPKTILEKQNDKDIYSLEGDIYFDSNYFSGGHIFKKKIFDKIKKNSNELNYNTAYVLFEDSVKQGDGSLFDNTLLVL